MTLFHECILFLNNSVSNCCIYYNHVLACYKNVFLFLYSIKNRTLFFNI